MIDYNIAEMFDLAFGIKRIGAYKVEKVGELSKPVDFNYTGVSVTDNLDYAAKLSSLGTPMIVPIKFKGKGKYKN